MDLASAAAAFTEHGYVVLPAYLDAEALTPAQAELATMFPTAEEYHSGADPERNARLTASAFAGIQRYPYESVEWSLLGLSPPIVTLAEALLGTQAIRLYEGHNWAKYGGATEYDQPLHRDYVNHGVVVPSPDARFAEVEMFIYVHDVPLDAGPTYVVSQRHTGDVPLWPPIVNREDWPDVYAHEVAADGPAGTVLAYRTDTLHRGSSMSDPKSSRFVLKASFRTVSDVWFDRLGLSDRLGANWQAFVRRATRRQLELAGFPPAGHPYWTAETWAGCCARYPGVDLTAFRPA